AADNSVLRATFDTLADGYHLLVGKNAGDLDAFTSKIEVALLLGVSLMFVLAAVASVSVTRRTVGRIEAINATSRSIMQSGLGKRLPLRGAQDEWDQLAENLNPMLDRVEALMAEVKQVSDNVAHDLRTPVPVGNLRPEILVVKSAQNWHRQRATDGLHGTCNRRVLVQR